MRKTILGVVIFTSLLGITAISGCKKDSSSEDWASGVAGVYTLTNNNTTPPEYTTVNVQKLTNKTVSIDIDVTGSFSNSEYNVFISPVTLTSSTTATFSKSDNDCDSARLNPPPNQWVQFCDRYTGTATFTSNSINLNYGSSRSYVGYPEDTTVYPSSPILAKK
jgi:hypothetical protein